MGNADASALLSDHFFDNIHYVIVTHVNEHRLASNFKEFVHDYYHKTVSE